MNYISTRNKNIKVTASKAIAQGISADGGLFVPEEIPAFSSEDMAFLEGKSYIETAKYVLKKYLTDFTDAEIDYCVNGAYTGSFDNEEPAPIYKINEKTSILELWHGPTCAFKDLALQLLPYLLTTSAKKVSPDTEIVILVATSGDTGKAALEGFKDVENTKIIVFYPSEGVSKMQKLQMDTQAGENVFVCAIKGNFDDAQTGVKKIFTDNKIAELLAESNKQFSSANSINWGRLVPQIVYYVYSYFRLKAEGADLSNGFNVCVPTGNFGNILAAYYAKEMGIPIKKLICASNSNKVLTDFISSGVYNRNREFHTTISPSMDILISSNLERMLFEISDRNDKLVSELQNNLSISGEYTVPADIAAKFKEIFFGGYCNEEQTKQTIDRYFSDHSYLCDTHTAVALKVRDDYESVTKDSTHCLVDSTASPYKFVNSVLESIGGKASDNEFDTVKELNKKSGCAIPVPIARLENAQVRFNNVCESDGMAQVVLNYLGL